MRVVFALLAVALINGCQSLAPEGRTPYPATELEQRLSTLQHWQAEGKIAIKAAEDSHSASFTWRQAGDDYHIHIFGPFGQGSTHLRREHREVTLENNDIGLRRATSAEHLMQDLLGWQVPVNAMQYWIKGLPSPVSPARLTRGPNDLIAMMEQDGWTVDFAEYDQIARWRLPAKIEAHRDDLRLRVVIKNWQL